MASLMWGAGGGGGGHMRCHMRCHMGGHMGIKSHGSHIRSVI